jgi:hypothetical protein
MSVGVMTVGVVSVGEITVGVMRRPQQFNTYFGPLPNKLFITRMF